MEHNQQSECVHIINEKQRQEYFTKVQIQANNNNNNANSLVHEHHHTDQICFVHQPLPLCNGHEPELHLHLCFKDIKI